MIDFTGVQAITIPEGAVAKIMRGADVLWEKPVTGDLPAGYTRVDHIRFTGGQTVDTGIICDQNTEIEITFTREVSAAMYLYGVRTTNNTASVTAYLNTNGAWRFGKTYKSLTPAVRAATHHAIQKSNGVTLNGTLNKYNATVTAFTAPATLTIGSAGTADGAYGDPSYIGNISDVKIRKGDNLVLEYIPCMNASGVYGFWDKVAKVFKTSITEVALQGA